MSSDKLAVSVSNLSKCYPIYDRPEDRFKQFLLPRLPGLGRIRRQTYFREFWALRDVSFDIPAGETFGIIGRNGSGKSTLLELICGTLNPTAGTIEVNGRVGALLELGAGFNSQFTGVENVYLAGALYGLSRGEVDDRFDRIAAFADIGDFIHQPIKTYSTGMSVRLAFAVIANIDADILVIDEALAVGDAYFVQKCMRFLRAFMERGTLLFVSHDTGAVLNLCKRALLLEGGGIEAIGRPKAIVERYLAALCAESQPAGSANDRRAVPVTTETEEVQDPRPEVVRGSSPPNDIEVFPFRLESGGFGTGRARVVSVKLCDESGRGVGWTIGGEKLTLEIRCRALGDIEMPVLGFVLKDRLGQIIFADNTYLTYRHAVPRVNAGGELEASFTFRMPILPTGDYSFSVAVAEGTQEHHIQHHWVDDALIIRAHTSSVCFGLIAVPMNAITLVTR